MDRVGKGAKVPHLRIVGHFVHPIDRCARHTFRCEPFHPFRAGAGSEHIEQDFAPKGLSEDTVRFISAKKQEPEWMLEWRLKAFRMWQDMAEPDWAKLGYPAIDYQDAFYYAAPKTKAELASSHRQTLATLLLPPRSAHSAFAVVGA